MIIHNIEQGTQEWFDIRKGKMTASHATAIGNAGTGLVTYIYEMMSEIYSSAEKEKFTSSDIERGNELEPLAREFYEMETGNKVEEVGFIEYNEYVGCSPDGLVGDDGGIEIKCKDDKKHLRLLIDEKIDTAYIRQIQMCLYITGRKWRDFISYNPNFKKSLFIKRIYPDDGDFTKLENGIGKGTSLIKKIENKYSSLLSR